MSHWLNCLPYNSKDWSLDSKNLYNKTGRHAGLSEFQPQEAEAGNPQISQPNKTSHIGKLWVELRDPATINKEEKLWGMILNISVGLPNVHTHTYIYITNKNENKTSDTCQLLRILISKMSLYGNKSISTISSMVASACNPSTRELNRRIWQGTQSKGTAPLLMHFSRGRRAANVQRQGCCCTAYTPQGTSLNQVTRLGC